MTVSVLGSTYMITKKKFDEEPAFKEQKIDGWCNSVRRLIVYCDMSTHPQLQDEPDDFYEKVEKCILRHEIIHAFFAESGLQESVNTFGGAWCLNEEMVDWFAIQSPKIYEAFQEVDAL